MKMKTILIVMALVSLMVLAGCSEPEAEARRVEPEVEETKFADIFECHITCMVTLFNTTKVNPINNECCEIWRYSGPGVGFRGEFDQDRISNFINKDSFLNHFTNPYTGISPIKEGCKLIPVERK